MTLKRAKSADERRDRNTAAADRMHDRSLSPWRSVAGFAVVFDDSRSPDHTVFVMHRPEAACDLFGLWLTAWILLLNGTMTLTDSASVHAHIHLSAPARRLCVIGLRMNCNVRTGRCSCMQTEDRMHHTECAHDTDVTAANLSWMQRRKSKMTAAVVASRWLGRSDHRTVDST